MNVYRKLAAPALGLLAACSLIAVARAQVPSPLPGVSAAPSQMPSPAPTPTIAILPPDAAPQILWWRLSSTTPQAGDTLSVVVLTSSNVASVELRIGGYAFNLPKTDVGHFEGGYVVPQLPFFVSHQLLMWIIARNTAGVPVENSVEIQVR
ncbi:MAG TPA: hypothetical protein VNU22_05505 [Candidatus Acidoferrum sp.]|nr:hypothetical protein [Candidatus Acidoferrum sp.]